MAGPALNVLLSELGRERPLSRRGFLGLLAGLAASPSLLAACGGGGASQSAASPAAPYLIGAIEPLTGALTAAYKPLFVVFNMAVDEINKSGGILGRELKVSVADDEGKAANETTVVRQLTDQQVNVIFGPTGSSLAQAALGVSQRAKVLEVVGSETTSFGDPTQYPGCYMTGTTSELDVRLTVDYMTSNKAVTKLAILRENTAFGQESLDLAQKLLASKSKTASVETYEQNAPSLAANIVRLKTSGADGVLLYSSTTADNLKAFTQMAQADYYPIVAAESASLVDLLPSLSGAQALPQKFLDNVRIVAYKNLTSGPGKPLAARQLAWAKKLAAQPDVGGNVYLAAISPYYDFMYVLKHAIESSKTFDYDKVKKALDATKNFDGILGKLTFSGTDHHGLAEESVTLAKVTDPKVPESLGFLPQIAS